MGHVFVIAEAGVNHNGSMDLAYQLVDAAAEAGADAVKFQTFRANALVSKTAAKAEYQLSTTSKSETQHEMIRKLELSEEQHVQIAQKCKDLGIQFLSTPFDIQSAHFLIDRFDLACVKVSSGDLLNAPLLLAIARTGKPMILSTGMATLEDIREALSVIAFGYLGTSQPPTLAEFQRAYDRGHAVLKEKVTLLHCTTEYPAPLDDVNLLAMATLREKFGLRVGYSDHTQGITVPIAATALGAEVIEKHFTLDRQLPGPDHLASLEPQELKSMVTAIRDVEQALGRAVKAPTPSEEKNRLIARRSLVASQAIAPGEKFSESNLSVKRPGSGVSPMLFWDVMGKSAKRHFEPDEMIEL